MMVDGETGQAVPPAPPPMPAAPRRASADPASPPLPLITPGQRDILLAAQRRANILESDLRRYLFNTFGVETLEHLPAQDGNTVLAWLQQPAPAERPLATVSKDVVTPAQRGKIIATQKECGVSDEDFKSYLEDVFGIKSRNHIPSEGMDEVLAWLQAQKEAEKEVMDHLVTEDDVP